MAIEQYVSVCVFVRSHRSSGRLNSSNLAVRTGSIYLYSHDVERAQVYSVDRVVVHPSFSAGGDGVAGDVALVRLARPLIVTDSVRPVCLHPDAASDARPGSTRYGVCVVAGWAPSRAPSSCLCLISYHIASYHIVDLKRQNHLHPSIHPSLFAQKFQLNSWPTFSPYLYNRVWSELTCVTHSRHRPTTHA